MFKRIHLFYLYALTRYTRTRYGVMSNEAYEAYCDHASYKHNVVGIA